MRRTRIVITDKTAVLPLEYGRIYQADVCVRDGRIDTYFASFPGATLGVSPAQCHELSEDDYIEHLFEMRRQYKTLICTMTERKCSNLQALYERTVTELEKRIDEELARRGAE